MRSREIRHRRTRTAHCEPHPAAAGPRTGIASAVPSAKPQYPRRSGSTLGEAAAPSAKSASDRQILDRVAACGQEPLEVRRVNHERRAVDVRMKRQTLRRPQIAIEEHADAMIAIVDETEW